MSTNSRLFLETSIYTHFGRQNTHTNARGCLKLINFQMCNIHDKKILIKRKLTYVFKKNEKIHDSSNYEFGY